MLEGDVDIRMESKTHVRATPGKAHFTRTADDDVGSQRATAAVDGVLLLADVLSVHILDLGAGDRRRGQDGPEDGATPHAASGGKVTTDEEAARGVGEVKAKNKSGTCAG